VGLSIGGEGPLDQDHLQRLKSLCAWLQPASFSEHLAWSTHEGVFLNDLLPLPYTAQTLARVCDHIDLVQNTLGRQMLLENPSSYLAFAETTLEEVDFLAQITARTGCGLLLDVNNVYISAINQARDPVAYLRDFPLPAVGEIHLGGHEADMGDYDAPLLIDSHSCAIAPPVWDLYTQLISMAGARATLIEWDNNVPEWPVLQAQAAMAEAILAQARVAKS
jgi:uncharacterized protein (UPF0276 family)